MTDLIPRAAVLEILRTPTAVDTFPDMIRRVEALEGGVRVKALEWAREAPYHVARVLGGHYSIENWDAGSSLRGTFLNGEYMLFVEAKAAAQADYEARILAALEPVAQPETPTPGQFTTMCLAIEDVVTGRGFDVDPWQPIETAPKDGTWILARHADIEDGRRQHWPGRVFVVKHMGYTAEQGYDMGWALFPGMGVGDESLSEWMPLPGETTSAIPEAVTAYLRNALMVGGWRGERE